MLFVYRSNSQKELLRRLCSVLAGATENILQPDWIVIGNYGISRWIQLQMTQVQGISANLKFFFPNQFLQQLFQLLPKEFISDKLLLGEEDWNWKMLELLLKFSALIRVLKEAKTNPTIALGIQSSERIK